MLLPDDELQRFVRLQTRVSDILAMYRRHTLAFIQSKYKVASLTEAIMNEAGDIPDDRKDKLRESIKTILGQVKIKFEVEMAEARKSGNRQLYFKNEYSLPYQNRLTSRLNKVIRSEAVVPIVNSIMGSTDPAVSPKVDEEIQSSRSIYPHNIFNRTLFSKVKERVASALYVDPDDVFEYLWDVIPENSTFTISMNKFDNIADNILKMDGAEKDDFYEFFDNYMDEVKSHFVTLANKYVVAEKLTLSIDDAGWFDFANQINSAMEEVAIDLTMTGMRLLKFHAVENSPDTPTI